MEGCPSAAAACTDVRCAKLILRAEYSALHSIRQEAFRRRRASDTASKKLSAAGSWTKNTVNEPGGVTKTGRASSRNDRTHQPQSR